MTYKEIINLIEQYKSEALTNYKQERGKCNPIKYEYARGALHYLTRLLNEIKSN